MNRNLIGLALADEAPSEAHHALDTGELRAAEAHEQLALVPAPPRPLTDRQARALEIIQSADAEGISGEQLGQAIGASPAWAKKTGLQLAKTLKQKGLVRQMRGGLYAAIQQTSEQPDGRFHPAMSDEIPY